MSSTIRCICALSGLASAIIPRLDRACSYCHAGVAEAPISTVQYYASSFATPTRSNFSPLVLIMREYAVQFFPQDPRGIASEGEAPTAARLLA